MLVKKLAVPLINEKILQQAEHCYIVTSHLTDAGFEFIRSRIPPKTKMDIVTSLDEPSDPAVLQRIFSNYQGRINLFIYTRNIIHANLYVFDLPFRKSVAFVGSGPLSLEGLKDNEELFWKVTNPKEVESLMSWYTTYFQFGVPLSEAMLRDYEVLFPDMKQRQLWTLREKNNFIKSSASAFSLEAIRFRNQFFSKEHYEVFSVANSGFDNASIRLARMAVKDKLLDLKKQIMPLLRALKLKESTDESGLSAELKDHYGGKVFSYYLSFLPEEPTQTDWVSVRIGISYFALFIELELKGGRLFQKHREQFAQQLSLDNFRQSVWTLLTALEGFTLEVCGVRKPVEAFPDMKAFQEFISSDRHNLFSISLQKAFSPGDNAISVSTIDGSIEKTLRKELELLTLLASIAQK